jgi:hypothetical protein
MYGLRDMILEGELGTLSFREDNFNPAGISLF